jgi:hypothetical protein
MGMQDRDWYREKKIDWDRGGLKERGQKGPRVPKYIWWIVGVVLFIIAVFFLGRF